MEFTRETIENFCARLASAEPVPGGGGAAALCGALSAALGEMVASLTRGKKKYASVEEAVVAASEQLKTAREALLLAIDADAAAFAPLSAAYRMPEGDEKSKAMQRALIGAAEAPLAAMEAMVSAIAPIAFLAEHGSRLAVSDAGAAGALLSASLRAASLNVYINAAAMADRDMAAAYALRADALLENALLAEKIFSSVKDGLTRRGDA